MKHLLHTEAQAKRIRDLAFIIAPSAFLHGRLKEMHAALTAASHIEAGHPVCRHADGTITPVLWVHMDPLPLPIWETE